MTASVNPDVEFSDEGQQRIPIALVFTDMVGSSAAKRAASLGPDASSRDRAYLAHIQSKHLHLVREAVGEFAGTEIMTIGDAFFLTFEDPGKALRCCAEIHRRLRANPILTPSGPLRLRIGLHVGTPEYFEHSWHGTDVDTAARVEAAGCAEQVILSDAARKLVGTADGIKFRRLGSYALKGVGDVVLWDADYSTHGVRRAGIRNKAQLRRLQASWLTAASLVPLLAWWAISVWPHPAQVHPNVSVLVSDFLNKTGDPSFDDTLEQPLSVALEGASFINTFNRNQAKKAAKEIGESSHGLDENAARLVARREGIAYVVSGSVEQSGQEYLLKLNAVDNITGRALGNFQTQVSSKDQILPSIPKLAIDVRSALGDESPRSAQAAAAAETYTASSLQAAKAYERAQDLQWAGDWPAAIAAYKEAIALDSQMGRAYSGLAVVSFNSGDRTAANTYFEQAMTNIGRMSERERYRTRGTYYLLQRDTSKAIEEYIQLVKKYPADSSGHANLALSYFYLRDMPSALREGMAAVDLAPKNVPQLNNVGLYAMYAGEFDRAIEEQNRVLDLNPRFNLAYVSKGLSQLALGRVEAADTWNTLARLNAWGASSASLGLADLAMYQGSFSDAAELLRAGAAHDIAEENKEEAGVKWANIAYADDYVGNTRAAVAAADKALLLSQDNSVRVMAAEVYVNANEVPKANAIALELNKKLDSDSRSYAKLINGIGLLHTGRLVDAIEELNAAQKISDTWLGNFYLGKAYLAAKAFAQADSEFDNCLRREGEATAIFLDEDPTFHRFPLVYYFDGIAREGLHSKSAAQSFQSFLIARSKPQIDPLAADAIRRGRSYAQIH